MNELSTEEQPKSRGEVVMTIAQAQNKRCPKGYSYEPVLPLLATPTPEHEPDGKRTRRQTPKALEANNSFRTPSFTPQPVRRTLSSGSMDKEQEKRRKKEEKQRLLAELERVRAVQRQCDEKAQQLTQSVPEASESTAATTAYNSPLPEVKQIRPSQLETPTEVMVSKRTPKANALYSGDNGDFVTGGFKLPPPEKSTKGKGPGKRPADRVINPQEAKRAKVGKDRENREARMMNLCSNVLRSVRKHKWAWIFEDPVDVEGLKLYDYFDIVKTPMDFKTIRGKIDNKLYSTPFGFRDDMRLCFSNCVLYNPKGSDHHVMALTLSDEFEKRWESANIEAKWLDELNRREQEELDIDATPSEAPPDVIMQEAMSSLKNQFEELKRTLAAQGGRSGSAQEVREMSFEEKRNLSNCLEQLPPDKLDRVVQIINEENILTGQDDNDELELDIDQLAPETLWKLHKYAQSCLRVKKPGRKKKEAAPKSSTARPSHVIPEAIDTGDRSSSGSGSSSGSDG